MMALTDSTQRCSMFQAVWARSGSVHYALGSVNPKSPWRPRKKYYGEVANLSRTR